MAYSGGTGQRAQDGVAGHVPIRRECTDHMIALGERHLSRVLGEFVAYYNSGRCHQALSGDAPEPRRRWSRDDGEVLQAKPVLGGLHHVYSRAA